MLVLSATWRYEDKYSQLYTSLLCAFYGKVTRAQSVELLCLSVVPISTTLPYTHYQQQADVS